MYKYSFAPVENPEIEILILGSMPGEKSLQEQEYYAHPHNRFWRLMSKLLKGLPTADYRDRRDMLLSNKIGLWDVIYSAQREGSLDSAIQNEKPNALDVFIASHDELKTICFNGLKSQSLYKKHFPFYDHIDYVTLPSSSPANARSRFDDLLKEWGTVFGNQKP